MAPAGATVVQPQARVSGDVPASLVRDVLNGDGPAIEAPPLVATPGAADDSLDAAPKLVVPRASARLLRPRARVLTLLAVPSGDLAAPAFCRLDPRGPPHPPAAPSRA